VEAGPQPLHAAGSADPPHADGSAQPEQAPAGAAQAHSTRHRAGWLRSNPMSAVALAWLIVGVAISIFAAQRVTRDDASASHGDFSRSASTIAAAVKTSLQRQEDAITAASTYFSGNSNGTPAEFHAWGRWARALRNHPDVQTLSLLALVNPKQLSAFEKRLGADPKTFALVPPVKGGEHCLAFTAISRSVTTLPPQGLDFCASNPALRATRESGHTTLSATPVASGEVIEEQTPVYRGAAPPVSSFGRHAAFVGWLRTVIEPKVMLQRVLGAMPAGAAQLRHTTPSSNSVYAVGAPQPGAQTAAVNLQGGWTLTLWAPNAGAGVFDHGDSTAVLIGGLLLSLLAGIIVLLLGRPSAPAPAARRVAPHKPLDLYDQLTGLPNRGLTMDRAERMLARAGRQSGLMVGALCIDIDWFKDINEKLGETAGDELLRIVADRLSQVVRTHDTVGRYGSDEFVVLVESAARGMRLDSLARRIIESLHKPVDLEEFGPSFVLTASIGVAFGRYATPTDLVRDARMALTAAKAAGKDRYTLFNANMRSVIEGRSVLEAELNQALQEEQFSLLYQPIVDLQSDRPIAMEALLRWQHPKRGEVSPGDFVPLAEESGLIVPIGRWALERACTDAAAWNVSGHRIAIAVKVSSYQLARDGVVTDVRRALQQSGLEPALLALEIAETTVMFDATASAKRLAELKELGIRIAIDDFGSGYAYRADLQRMPIDFLKVDRSSLAASEDEDYRGWLLEAVLAFGRDLSLTVVAKGVESEEHLTTLREMGCQLAQGYFVGAPIQPGDVEATLGKAAVAPAPMLAGIPVPGGIPPATPAEEDAAAAFALPGAAAGAAEPPAAGPLPAASMPAAHEDGGQQGGGSDEQPPPAA
ncbi:MAG: bifunctional diguanylate cyclase/phosphodiesterase, partial [Solirubrobacteraceae bacterium]